MQDDIKVFATVVEQNSFAGAAKILGLILSSRLMHWALAQRLISDEQVGFMPRRGCEHQAGQPLDCLRCYSPAQAASFGFQPMVPIL